MRERLPATRDGVTHKFSVGGHECYLTVNCNPATGDPAELFIVSSKQGSTIRGFVDAFACVASIALQNGTPLETLTAKFKGVRFEPLGLTSNAEIPQAQSIIDYVFQYLDAHYQAKK